ncbi:MAG: serine hydrolase domain-containing protein [Flavobacteriales bacterium]
MKRSALLVAMMLAVYGAFAQPTAKPLAAATTDTAFPVAQMNAYLDALEAANRFMGAVAVSRNGNILYQHTLGYADVEAQRRIDATTQVRIGSISKSFTAVLVFKALEAGKLSLTSTLDAHFPSIPNAKKITIDHLLRHKSGIHNFTNDPDFLSYHTSEQSKPAHLDRIAAAGSDFDPGLRSEYSNSNTVLLSFILEEVFGKPYAELLDMYIVGPAKLENTGIMLPAAKAKNAAFSYTYTTEWVREAETHPSVPLGAGAVASTAVDLLRFADALHSGKLIGQESLAEMKRMDGAYGAGLFILPYGTEKSYGHTGGIDGFASMYSHFPNEGISFAIITNGNRYDLNEVAIAVLDATFGNDFAIPTFSDYTPTADELNKLTGEYTSAQLPIAMTISVVDGVLTAQATGQPSFPLEAVESNHFRFTPAGVVMRFAPELRTLTLEQGGGVFVFSR